MTTSSSPHSALPLGRDALARYAWEEAFDAFRRAVEEDETAEAHECLSWAAWWRNDADALFRSREAAFRLFRQAGDTLGAARMAMWLAADHADFRGELSVASGWRQRARRLLEDAPLSREHGWELLLRGDAALLYEGDTVTARQCADEAMAVGRTLGVVDFTILPLALEGLSLVEQGDVDGGLRLLDEAAVAVLSEELESPLWAGWAICYLLFACERARDFDRATEWCRRLRELSERYDMHYSLGICRAHYASVLIWRGEWRQAEEHLSAAGEILGQTRVPWTVEALIRLADLRRRQGRLDEAADLFAQAEWHPLSLFGLAELALDVGKPKDAEECIERALRQTPEHSRHQRAIGLELLVRAQSLLGQHARAAETLRELNELSDSITPTPPLRAAAEYTAGIVAIGTGDYEGARAHLEDAVSLGERGGAPYEVARARLELASVLVSLGRLERARAEADTARETLERLGSRLYASRASALLRDIERRGADAGAGEESDRPVLTRRQVQILRLIAHGKSDREIASTLKVSEHTVHRHVANILMRMETQTRASAAAAAASRGLI